MSGEDRLREALARAAPTAPNAGAARAALGPAMAKARRRYRIRRSIAAATVTVGVMGGTAVAAVHFVESDSNVDTYATLPDPKPDATTTSLPGPTSPSASAPPSTAVPTTTDPAAPASSAPESVTSLPTTASTTPPPTPTTAPVSTTAPESPTTQPPGPNVSGPHLTDCGTVTFVWSTSVSVESHTSGTGYRFIAEGEGSGEVEAKWVEGPEDECKVAAHLEGGELEIQIDDDDQS